MKRLLDFSKTIRNHKVFFALQYFAWFFMLVSQYLGRWSEAMLYIIVPVFVVLNVYLAAFLMQWIRRAKADE